MPAADLKLSVFRRSHLDEGEYADIRDEVARRSKRTTKGAALAEASVPIDAGLGVEPEESAFRWHADVVLWPEEKHEQKALAQAIAETAVLE